MTYVETCRKAAEIAKRKQEERYVIRNPDYPEEGGEFAIASDFDLDSYWQGLPSSAILAIYTVDGTREDA
jgi:hypothetical protein